MDGGPWPGVRDTRQVPFMIRHAALWNPRDSRQDLFKRGATLDVRQTRSAVLLIAESWCIRRLEGKGMARMLCEKLLAGF